METAGRLFEAGDVAGAMETVSPGFMNIVAVHRAAAAKAAGDATKALRLYEQYFRYFPFGDPEWNSRYRDWNEAASAYLELRLAARAKGGANDETLDQDLAARKVYDELLKHYEDGKHVDRVRLADRILTAHPKSLFCVAAVLSVGGAAAENRGGGCPEPQEVYRGYVEKMERAGVPERQRVVVLLTLAHHYSAYAPAIQAEDGAAVCRELAGRTRVPYEKR